MEEPWIALGDGTDHFTPLPMEVRAHIASFQQVVQMSVLSRPWRDIHHHTASVRMSHGGAGVESTLARRAEARPRPCRVNELMILCGYGEDADECRVMALVNRIVALATS